MRSILVVLLCVAGCGDDDGVNKLPDAPRFQDAPADGSTAGAVTLTITTATGPAMGVRVYFQNADSSVVSAAMTDANGVASAVMDPGGSVTAIDPFVPDPVGQHDLRTFAGVKPGDQLVLKQLPGALGVTFTLQLPVEPTAAQYLLYAPCTFAIDVTDTDGSGGGTGPGGPVTLTGCGDTTDLVVVVNDLNGQAIKSLHHANVALAEGGTVDLTADTYTATTASSWAYQNVPAEYGSLNIDSFLVSPRGVVFETFTSAVLTAGAATTTPINRPVVPETVQVDATVLFGPPFGLQQVIAWGPPTTLATLDGANVLVPQYSSNPVFDVATHAVSWTTEAGGAPPQLAIADVAFSDLAKLSWRWQVAAPATTTSVVFPVLPAPDTQFDPIAGDSINVNNVTTAIVPGGYDGVRATILDLTSGVRDLVAGPSGRIVAEEALGGRVRKRGPSGMLRLRVKSTR